MSPRGLLGEPALRGAALQLGHDGVELDAAGLTATVQPGVVNAALGAAACLLAALSVAPGGADGRPGAAGAGAGLVGRAGAGATGGSAAADLLRILSSMSVTLRMSSTS